MGFGDLLLFYVITGISLRWIATASRSPSSIIVWAGAWFCSIPACALGVGAFLTLSKRRRTLHLEQARIRRLLRLYVGLDLLDQQPAVLPCCALLRRQQCAVHPTGGLAAPLGKCNVLHPFRISHLERRHFAQHRGPDVGKWLHNVGALAMWIPVCIVIILGFVALHRYGSATSFTIHSMTPSTHLNDLIFWSVLTFAFGGCETASFMGDEIKNARRTIPLRPVARRRDRHDLLHPWHVCVLLALPSTEVNSLQGWCRRFQRRQIALGIPGILPVAAFLSHSAMSARPGRTLPHVARLPFVAGLDRVLPASFGALHPRWIHRRYRCSHSRPRGSVHLLDRRDERERRRPVSSAWE